MNNPLDDALADNKSPTNTETDSTNVDVINEPDAPFIPMGYNRDTYFIYIRAKKQIITYTQRKLSESGLIELACLDWWERNNLTNRSGKIEKCKAVDIIFRACIKAGLFNPDIVRGRGAWIDNNRFVFHLGNRLWIDGNITPLERVQSEFYYEAKANVRPLQDKTLTTLDGERILEAFRLFHWHTPASAALILGWVMLAPICGILKWRPHIWITGGAGSGKTTVMEFIHWLMNGGNEYAQGNSTEAGIRQKLQNDALPVLYDESEQNNENDIGRVQSVLSLMRQSSTESAAQTFKGTPTGSAVSFHVRSMFCLSSIQVGIRHQADRERISIMALRSKREITDPTNSLRRLREALHEIQSDDKLPGRLFMRSLDIMPIIRKNIEVFSHEATKMFGTQRAGDQLGTLLAGYWSMLNQGEVTPEKAKQTLDEFEWSEFSEQSETEECNYALAAFMECQIPCLPGRQCSIYELLLGASSPNLSDSNVPQKKEAESILLRYGIRLHDNSMCLSNLSNAHESLLRNTPFAADFRSHLLRLPGASKSKSSITFLGQKARYVQVPLKIMFDGPCGQEGQSEPKPQI